MVENKDILMIDGSTIYVIDDLIYIDSDSYSHFYKLLDAFHFYKKVQEVFKKSVVFKFQEYGFLIDENTNYNGVLNQCYKQIKTIDKLKKEEEKENNEQSKQKSLYKSYLKQKNPSFYNTFYRNDMLNRQKSDK